MDRPTALLLLLAALACALAGSTWPGFLSPNEYARTYPARAMVERGTWEIGPELRTFGYIEDRARIDDRYYSNKPPGLTWLAVPVVAVVAAVAPERSVYVDNYAARLALSLLPALLGAALLGAWLRRRDQSAALGVGLLLFGTFWGLSATHFWGHVATGSLLLACAWLLYGEQDRIPDRTAMLLAGFLGCFTVVCEYPAAVAVTFLFAPAVIGRWRRIPPIVAGLSVPLIGLGIYNLTCFGTAFTLSNRYDDAPGYAELGQSGAFGMGLASPEGLFGILASPLMGLFFLSPFLLPALAAPVVLWRRGERAFAAGLAACVWVQPFVMAGYANWHGGAVLGPRYVGVVVPMFVLAALLVPLGRWRSLWLGSAAASLLLHAAIRIVPPFAINDVPWASTVRGWVIPAIREGLVNGLYRSTGAVLVVSALVIVALHLGGVLIALRDAMSGSATRLLLGGAALVLALQVVSGTVTVRQVAWLWHATQVWPVVQDPVNPAPVPPVPRDFAERYLGPLPEPPQP